MESASAESLKASWKLDTKTEVATRASTGRLPPCARRRSAVARLTQVTLVWLLSAFGARGEDLTTVNGKVLRDIEIQEVDCDSITIKHREGVSKIHLADLPSELRQRFSPAGLLQELRQKTAELEKLKSELASVRAAAASATRAAESSANLAASTRARTERLAKPMPPIASLPTLKGTDVVAAEDIVHYYSADPRSADLRYRKQAFRIQGKIERFEEKLFVRKTVIFLESPERAVRILCEFPFPDEFSAVYSTQNGQVLVGVSGTRRNVRLMELGESVTLEGKCAGLQNGAIVFNQCHRVQ